MKKSLFIFYILIIFPVMLVSSSEQTDILLESAIEEFSKENYDGALEIIDRVLEEEPDNTIAQDYRKTIEEIANINNGNDEVVEEEEGDKPDLLEELGAKNGNKNKDKSKKDVLSIYAYGGVSTDNYLIMEQGIKLILGLPVFNISVKTNPLSYEDNEETGDEALELQDLFSSSNMGFDFSVGLRYFPYERRNVNGGFADFKLGAFNFTEDDTVIPYVGFDAEVHMLAVLGSNFFFNNFWLGGRGSLYLHNDQVVDNYYIEGKAGINLGHFNIGAYYSVADMTSLETEIYNKTAYGIKLGLSF